MTTQTTNEPSNGRLNGLDTQVLAQTVDALKRDRTLAKFEFRAGNTWIGGTTNRSTIQGFFGAGAEDKSRSEPFTFTNGEPPLLLGATKARTRWNFCCMRWLAASRRPPYCTPRHAVSASNLFQPN